MQSTLIVMVGAPGSGKSTYASRLAKAEGGVICSADYWMVDEMTGEYKFDPSKLNNCHRLCQHKAWVALCAGRNPVIIDNTNLTLLEVAPYVALAGMAEVEAGVHVDVDFVVIKESFEICRSRQIHGVPDFRLEKMCEAAQRWASSDLPPYWGIRQVTIL